MVDDAWHALMERAKGGWAGVAEQPEAFASFVRARLGEGQSPAALFAEDLALSWACASGQPGAVAEFERRFGDLMERIATQYAGDATSADDVVQGIRARLFSGEEARIGRYAGRGALEKWVQVTVRRAGLDFVRASGRRPDVLGDEPVLDDRVRELDPELDYMKEAYREAFEAALADALGSLTSRQRNVLRHRLVNELRVDEIAGIYRVNRKTITRWIAAAREDLLIQVRTLLQARLQLPPEEFTSLIRLVRSRLDLSLSLALKPSDAR